MRFIFWSVVEQVGRWSMQLSEERSPSETRPYLLSPAPPLVSQGNSSNVLGLFAIARCLTAGELGKDRPAIFDADAGRRSSGNCSITLGLLAMARFLATSANALVGAERPVVSPRFAPLRAS